MFALSCRPYVICDPVFENPSKDIPCNSLFSKYALWFTKKFPQLGFLQTGSHISALLSLICDGGSSFLVHKPQNASCHLVFWTTGTYTAVGQEKMKSSTAGMGSSQPQLLLENTRGNKKGPLPVLLPFLFALTQTTVVSISMSHAARGRSPVPIKYGECGQQPQTLLAHSPTWTPTSKLWCRKWDHGLCNWPVSTLLDERGHSGAPP